MPLTWIRDNNDEFLVDLAADEHESLETISRLKAARLTEPTVSGLHSR
jgi:hypothetical protein